MDHLWVCEDLVEKHCSKSHSTCNFEMPINLTAYLHREIVQTVNGGCEATARPTLPRSVNTSQAEIIRKQYDWKNAFSEWMGRHYPLVSRHMLAVCMLYISVGVAPSCADPILTTLNVF